MRSHNFVLGSLTRLVADDSQKWIRLVMLHRRQVLLSPDRSSRYVYFPVQGTAVIYGCVGGRTLAVATMGSEGSTAFAIQPPAAGMPWRVVVASTSAVAIVCEASHFEPWLQRHHEVSERLRRSTHALLASVIRAAACHHYHPLRHRCCQWLLRLSRGHNARLDLTQAELGAMAGGSRAGVNEVCTELVERRLIRWTRASVEILNANGLRRSACDCPAAIEQEYARVLH